MPNTSRLIQGALLATVVAHSIKTRIKARKAAALYLAAHAAFEEVQRVNETQIQYLCHMLNEHNVPADEFDLIALHYHQ